MSTLNFKMIITFIGFIFTSTCFAQLSNEVEKNIFPANGILQTHFEKVREVFNHPTVEKFLKTDFNVSDSKTLMENLENLNGKISKNPGFICATEYDHCFAIYLADKSEPLNSTVVINQTAWGQEENDDVRTIGILHEGLSALYGHTDVRYEKSTFYWYLAHKENNHSTIRLEQKIVDVPQKEYHSGEGGVTSVGGGDFASIKLKWYLLEQSDRFYAEIPRAHNKCANLEDFQALILRMRVEPSNKIITAPYWDSSTDTIFIKLSSLLEIPSLREIYLRTLSGQLLSQRGCNGAN